MKPNHSRPKLLCRYQLPLIMVMTIFLLNPKDGCRQIPTFNGTYEVTFSSEENLENAGPFRLNLSQNEMTLNGSIEYNRGDLTFREAGSGEVHQKAGDSFQSFTLKTLSAPEGASASQTATEFIGSGRETSKDNAIDQIDGHYTFKIVYREERKIDPGQNLPGDGKGQTEWETKEEIIDRGSFSGKKL